MADARELLAWDLVGWNVLWMPRHSKGGPKDLNDTNPLRKQALMAREAAAMKRAIPQERPDTMTEEEIEAQWQKIKQERARG